MVLHTGDKDWNDKKHGVVACKQHSFIGKVVDQVTVQVLVTVLWRVVECASSVWHIQQQTQEAGVSSNNKECGARRLFMCWQVALWQCGKCTSGRSAVLTGLLCKVRSV